MNAFTTYARGVDVSWYQRGISWKAMPEAEVAFAFLRVADGVALDSTFARHWKDAGKLGLLRGAYHVLRPDVDGQAMDIFKMLQPYKLELGLWADLEIHGLTAERCERFLEAADRKFGRITGVYTRASFIHQFGLLPWSVGRPLWIADPVHPWPVMPSAWQGDWDFWQFSQVTIGGKRVDLNLYHGTAEELRARYAPS